MMFVFRQFTADMVKSLTELTQAQKKSIAKMDEIAVASSKARYALSVLEGRVKESEEATDVFLARLKSVEKKLSKEKLVNY
jgi:uncharacterized NAD(P)/FAD-binding protein YdhS